MRQKNQGHFCRNVILLPIQVDICVWVAAAVKVNLHITLCAPMRMAIILFACCGEWKI